jgi:hypothetical protein
MDPALALVPSHCGADMPSTKMVQCMALAGVTEAGVVDFSKKEVEFVETGLSGRRPQPSALSWVDGIKEYDCFFGPPGDQRPGRATTMYPLGALAFPLLAVNGRDRAIELGHRQLGGTMTTEYSLEAPASAGLGGTHVSAHPVELWLDSQGRIRKVSYSELLTTPSSVSVIRRSTTSTYGERLSFSDLGVPVNISPPGGECPKGAP